jgi:hypothetical protein
MDAAGPREPGAKLGRWLVEAFKGSDRAMSKAEQFQRHAEKCQDLAAAEANPDFRSSWLVMARSWLFLLEQERRLSSEYIDRVSRVGREVPPQFH